MNDLQELFRFFDDVFLDRVPQKVDLGSTGFPPMNIWVGDESKDLVLEFAVAGIPEDAIDIQFEGDYLTMDIENTNVEREGFTKHYAGIKASHSRKKIFIPQSRYKVLDATAHMDNGILTIAVPAQEEIKPRTVKIVMQSQS